VGEGIVICTADSLEAPLIIPEEPTLSASDFVGLRRDLSLMGVLNICRVDESYLITFEGYETNYDQKGQIFGCYTKDWKSFQPANGGFPIFSARDVRSWPVKAVCNPRVFRVDDHWYGLGFNGSQEGEYSIGLALTKNFSDWFEHPSNPILVPRGWPSDDPMTGRLEGLCVDADAFATNQSKIKVLFMAIPYGARNHEKSVIGAGTLTDCRAVKSFGDLKYFPRNENAVLQEADFIELRASLEPSKYLHAHLISNTPLKKVSLSLEILSLVGRGAAAYIVISNTLNSFPRGLGQIIKLDGAAVSLRRSFHAHGKNNIKGDLLAKLLRFLRRKISLIELFDYDHFDYLTGWSYISDSGSKAKIEATLGNASLEKNTTEIIGSNVTHSADAISVSIPDMHDRVLTLVAYKADVRVSRLSYI
jgi:hypothetical protein